MCIAYRIEFLKLTVRAFILRSKRQIQNLFIVAKLNSADRVKVSYTESLWLTSRASDHGIQRSEVGFLIGAQNFSLCPWKNVSFAQGFTSKTRLNAKPIKENEILSSFRYYSV